MGEEPAGLGEEEERAHHPLQAQPGPASQSRPAAMQESPQARPVVQTRQHPEPSPPPLPPSPPQMSSPEPPASQEARESARMETKRRRVERKRMGSGAGGARGRRVRGGVKRGRVLFLAVEAEERHGGKHFRGECGARHARVTGHRYAQINPAQRFVTGHFEVEVIVCPSGVQVQERRRV